VHQTIYFPEVKAFCVCHPPIADQPRIARILDEVLEGIATASGHGQDRARADRGAGRLQEAQHGADLVEGRGGRKGDVTVAKNYLREEEIDQLNRIVVMFLDFAEDQARRRKQIFLRDWRTRLDDFLRFNERAVLPGPGKVSREQADSLAERAYDEFAARRRAELEAAAEADALEQLRGAVEELPAARKRKPPKR
jgi:hypothetical protein